MLLIKIDVSFGEMTYHKARIRIKCIAHLLRFTFCNIQSGMCIATFKETKKI